MPEPTIDEMLVNVRTAINNALLAKGGTIEWEYNGRRVKSSYLELLEVEKSLVRRRTAETPVGDLRTLATFDQRPR